MLTIYNSDEKNSLNEISEFKKGSWINMVNPSPEEIEKVCSSINIQDGFIKYSLDYDEQARIDQEDDDKTTLLMIDVPFVEKNKDYDYSTFTTMPLGIIIVRDEYLLTVSLYENDIIKNIEKNSLKNFNTSKRTKAIFQILSANCQYFINSLKLINKETETISQSLLKTSMQNERLLKLLDLNKALVYFTTSLKSNELVIEKISRGKVLKLYEEDQEILEDTIVENRQAIEMSQIYTNILNETTETYSSIISNNLNRVMRFLTAITIIIAIPTLISGLWGMNVNLPFQSNPYGFPITCLIAVLLSVIVTIWLKKKDML